MKTKNLFGFFMAIAIISLMAITTISATENMISSYSVEIDGINAYSNDISVIAGETMTVEVTFTAEENFSEDIFTSDVKFKAELEGEKVDVEANLFIGDIEAGMTYTRTFTLSIPYELQEELSGDLSLNMKLWNGNFRTDLDEITLRVQRPAYNVAFMSIFTSQTVEAGDMFPVDVVLKNNGYNDLDNLYLTVQIPSLNVIKTIYAGDIYSQEGVGDYDDEEDTISFRVILQIPYDAQSGIYNLEVEATNDDLVTNAIKQIAVNNDFANYVIVNDYSQSFATGENGVYNLLIVNPTNNLKVFRIVTESINGITTSVSESIVAIPAGSSQSVQILADASAQGEYAFNVNVFSGENLVGTVTLSADVESGVASNAIVILTFTLIVIFLVLLIILVVLLRKKPEKSEDFSESYY